MFSSSPSFFFFFSQCGACWASAAVSARQIAISPSMRRSSPLAISFSHRAKVTWLTTVSHLAMQKDYQFVGLLSDGDASSLSLFLNRPSIMKGCRLRDCAPFVTRRVKCCRHSHCCPHATLITPVENSSRILFASPPAPGPLPSSSSSSSSFSFFFFFFFLIQQCTLNCGVLNSYLLLALSGLRSSFSYSTVK